MICLLTCKYLRATMHRYSFHQSRRCRTEIFLNWQTTCCEGEMALAVIRFAFCTNLEVLHGFLRAYAHSFPAPIPNLSCTARWYDAKVTTTHFSVHYQCIPISPWRCRSYQQKSISFVPICPSPSKRHHATYAREEENRIHIPPSILHERAGVLQPSCNRTNPSPRSWGRTFISWQEIENGKRWL